jgi:glycerol kinase
MIAWKIGQNVNYLLEAINSLTGTMINWAIDQLQLAKTPQELDKLAESVQDTKNLFFIPALNGLRFPHYNPYARGTFVGLTLEHTKAHLCRAILEGIAYCIKDFINQIEKEFKININSVFCDGGVSKSNPLLQFSADIMNKEFVRAAEKESTALGAAFLAGLAVGYWKNLNELKSLKKIDRVFKPQMDPQIRDQKYKKWEKAVKRSFNWAK